MQSTGSLQEGAAPALRRPVANAACGGRPAKRAWCKVSCAACRGHEQDGAGADAPSRARMTRFAHHAQPCTAGPSLLAGPPSPNMALKASHVANPSGEWVHEDAGVPACAHSATHLPTLDAALQTRAAHDCGRADAGRQLLRAARVLNATLTSVAWTSRACKQREPSRTPRRSRPLSPQPHDRRPPQAHRPPDV